MRPGARVVTLPRREVIAMAGGRAFKSNVRERREAERRMKALEKRQKKEEKRRQAAEAGTSPVPPSGHPAVK